MPFSRRIGWARLGWARLGWALTACSCSTSPPSKAPAIAEGDSGETASEDSPPTTDSGPGEDSAEPADSPPPVDTAVEDTGEVTYDDTIVLLDGGDFTAFDSDSHWGGMNVGNSAYFAGDVWGDGRPELMVSGWYTDADVTDANVFFIDSETLEHSSGVHSIVDASRLVVNGDGYNIDPYPIKDLDGDGLDEVMVSSASIGIPPALYWGSRLAVETGTLNAFRDGDVYITSYFGAFGFDGDAGYVTDLDHGRRDLVLTIGYQIAIIPGGEVAGPGYEVDGTREAILYSGSSGPRTPDPYTAMGFSRVLGDIDGDGLNEVVAGSSGTPMGVLIEVVYGDSVTPGSSLYAEDADVLFTFPTLVDEDGDCYLAPTPLGDVDGDGTDDLTLARGDIDADGLVGRGVGWLWSGARLSAPAMLDAMDGDVEFVSTHPSALVGQSVGDIGDMDGDGLADFLIHGAGRSDEGDFTARPFVHLVRGSEVLGGGTFDVDHASVGFQSSEPVYQSQGGYDGDADIDGDGINDLVIGNGDHSGAFGRVWLVPGSLVPL